jgi:hypothetical protein
LIHALKPKRAARFPQGGEQVVLGLFHAVPVFRLLFHAASTRSARLRGRRGSALPRSDRVVQPWSFAAVSAMARTWYRVPASSFSLGCRCASSPAMSSRRNVRRR